MVVVASQGMLAIQCTANLPSVCVLGMGAVKFTNQYTYHNMQQHTVLPSAAEACL